jgi:membrane protein YqaA with SNARE-associated domain
MSDDVIEEKEAAEKAAAPVKCSPLRRLYDWAMGIAGHRHAVPWLGFISFIESMIFPIPPDVMLMPMCLAERRKAFFFALVCTVASVLGGLGGYMLGHLFYEGFGQKIVAFYGYEEPFMKFQDYYIEWGVWIVLLGGLTPFPYKVITIASGVAGLNLWLFMLVSVIARASRFFLVAALLWFFGEKIRIFIEKYLGLLTLLFFMLLLGGFAVIKYL